MVLRVHTFVSQGLLRVCLAVIFICLHQAVEDVSAVKSPPKNPFRSPSGALILEVAPMIEESLIADASRCDGVTFDKSEVPLDSMLWPWAGLQRVTKRVYVNYLKQREKSHQTLHYQSGSQDRQMGRRRLQGKKSDETIERVIECVALRMVLNGLPMARAVCSCLSSLDPEGYCQLVDAFVEAVHCHDKMAAQIDKSLMCPTLLTKSMDVEISTMCSGHLAGTISSLDFDLYTLGNLNLTPDQADRKFFREEARAYYVALKAIERLTKWTDAHLLCSDDNPDHERLKDVQLLESWDSKIYFWIVEPSGRKIPLAVLAQRSPQASSSRTYQSVENTIIVIRNIKTTFEGRLFLTNGQSRKYTRINVGPVHAGYDAVACLMVPPLAQFLTKFFSTSTPYHPKITTIGHGNFGAGIGAIIARDLANQFVRTPRTHRVIEHNLIAIEGGPVGGHEFTTDLKKKVNVRNIVSDNSGFSQLPCENIRGCGYEHQVVTGTLGTSIGPYLNLPGTVTIDSGRLPDNVWRTNMTHFETVAHMQCAALCWLASEYCPDDGAPRCDYKGCGAFLTREAEQTWVI